MFEINYSEAEYAKNIISGVSTLSIIGIAEAIAVICFIIALCLNYVNSFIESTVERPKFYDPKELKRTIIIMVMIPLATYIVKFIMGVGDICNSYIKITTKEKFDLYVEVFKRSKELDFNLFSPEMGIVVVLVSILLFSITTFIKSALVVILAFFKSYLIVVAPLGLAFSTLPFLKDQFTKLVKISLNVAFVTFTLNLLDSIFFSALLKSKKIIETMNNAEFFHFIGSLSVCLIVMYILCVWLTSLYVGDPSAAAIMTTMTTMATMAAMAAMKAFTGGNGGGSNSPQTGSELAKDIVESAVKGND